MIVYRCDRCGKDIDIGLTAFDGEEYSSLDIRFHKCRGFNYTKHYLLCETCTSIFENFMKDHEGLINEF